MNTRRGCLLVSASVSLLLASCFTVPPQAPAPTSDQLMQARMAEANRVAGEMGEVAKEADKPKEVSAANPMGGVPAEAQRNMTPMGWNCDPDQPFEFTLERKGKDVCVSMLSSDVHELGTAPPMSRPVTCQLVIDGRPTSNFSLEPEGTPSAFSDCLAPSTQASGKQWVARYRGCFKSTDQLTQASQSVELLFPDSSGQTPIVIWHFTSGDAR